MFKMLKVENLFKSLNILLFFQLPVLNTLDIAF